MADDPTAREARPVRRRLSQILDAFESDDLTRIVDCIRRLREAEARRYTKLDIPFVLGIRTELRDAVIALA